MLNRPLLCGLGLSIFGVCAPDVEAQQPKPPAPQAGREAASGERSIEEVKAVFSQHSDKIFEAYRRALQRRPTLAGKAGYVLEVSPDGDAVNPELAWSNLNDPELEREIATIILSMKFGKKGTKRMIVSFPIELQPK
jgi:hypothetical protein